MAIARALAAQPQCILYDEPTTMVDPIMSDHLGNLMLRLKKQLKLTSVVVTHDLDLMYKVADRVVFLFEGSVIFFGPTADLEHVGPSAHQGVSGTRSSRKGLISGLPRPMKNDAEQNQPKPDEFVPRKRLVEEEPRPEQGPDVAQRNHRIKHGQLAHADAQHEKIRTRSETARRRPPDAS